MHFVLLSSLFMYSNSNLSRTTRLRAGNCNVPVMPSELLIIKWYVLIIIDDVMLCNAY